MLQGKLDNNKDADAFDPCVTRSSAGMVLIT